MGIEIRLMQYHRAKENWLWRNPGATQAQIDAAMRRIAKECKI